MNSPWIVEAALRLAESGLYVFPCHSPTPRGDCSCRRIDCPNHSKHPRTTNGLKDATRDPAIINEWWRRWRTSNIGLSCGPSKLVVLDYDPAHDPERAGYGFLESIGAVRAPTVRTGGDGYHYYFQSPPGAEVRNSAGLLAPGVDVRGVGGYVLAPPSMHRSGKAYSWISDRTSNLIEALPTLPQTLSSAKERHPTEGDIACGPISPGRRNHELTRLAGAMHRRYASEVAMVAALLEENRARCNPPLDEAEVRRIVASIRRRPAGPTAHERAFDCGPSRLRVHELKHG
jgi:putative DNA primase/helicase